jgi:hypothetical protein
VPGLFCSGVAALHVPERLLPLWVSLPDQSICQEKAPLDRPHEPCNPFRPRRGAMRLGNFVEQACHWLYFAEHVFSDQFLEIYWRLGIHDLAALGDVNIRSAPGDGDIFVPNDAGALDAGDGIFL